VAPPALDRRPNSRKRASLELSSCYRGTVGEQLREIRRADRGERARSAVEVHVAMWLSTTPRRHHGDREPTTTKVTFGSNGSPSAGVCFFSVGFDRRRVCAARSVEHVVSLAVSMFEPRRDQVRVAARKVVAGTRGARRIICIHVRAGHLRRSADDEVLSPGGTRPAVPARAVEISER